MFEIFLSCNHTFNQNFRITQERNRNHRLHRSAVLSNIENKKAAGKGMLGKEGWEWNAGNRRVERESYKQRVEMEGCEQKDENGKLGHEGGNDRLGTEGFRLGFKNYANILDYLIISLVKVLEMVIIELKITGFYFYLNAILCGIPACALALSVERKDRYNVVAIKICSLLRRVYVMHSAITVTIRNIATKLIKDSGMKSPKCFDTVIFKFIQTFLILSRDFCFNLKATNPLNQLFINAHLKNEL
ncbi:hypothetical protein KUTeg_007142 [Tegillarca granosa]|uniref:Uncharacterized protein n=1 Tax=Tegillarca granosa TaxID=220873 RepID=A0ABQ9FCF3_TEGGR|nr:hypothetical protein KUTeg_007142 [Tegillarca granosa]